MCNGIDVYLFSIFFRCIRNRYSGFQADNEWLIGAGMALDPKDYFIIVVSALGNGQSR
jgi:hypothetical protein